MQTGWEQASLTPPPSSSLSPLCWCPLLRLGHVALLGEYLARVAPRRRERRSGCDVRSNSERLAGKKTKQNKKAKLWPVHPRRKRPRRNLSLPESPSPVMRTSFWDSQTRGEKTPNYASNWTNWILVQQRVEDCRIFQVWIYCTHKTTLLTQFKTIVCFFNTWPPPTPPWQN